MSSRMLRSLLVSTTVASLAACGTTIDDPAAPTADAADVGDVPVGAEPALEDGAPIEGGVIVDDTAPTTMPIAGSAADLLPEMAAEMSRLGSLIANGDGDDESLARIESIWNEISDEVRDTHPQLINGIDATVDMARTAVDTTRPADADKAFGILTDLVDKFFGE